MRTKQRNFAMALLGFILAIAMVLGYTSLSAKTVNAAPTGTPTLTMVNGAQVRYLGDPGIKFTAVVENYSAEYKYGLLILPESAFEKYAGEDFYGNYHAFFKAKGITNYADKSCSVYEKGGQHLISLALTDIEDYDMGFVGVAYTLKDGVYTYADVTMANNARSISYVAQMALKYEQGLKQEDINYLREFVTSDDFILGTDDYLNDGNISNGGSEGEVIPNDYAMKYIFNAAGETVSQITKKAYASGSQVSFKYYVPADTPMSWWGIAWHTDPSKANVYHAAGAENAIGYHALGKTTGAWVDVSFTLPAGGPFYLYFGSEVSSTNWKIDGQNSYALIDNFTIGSTTETFASADLNDSIFSVLSGAGAQTELMVKGGFLLGESVYTQENALKYTFNVGMDEKIPFITTEAYAAGSKVEFMYYVPEGVTYSSAWWIWAWTTSKSSIPYYAQTKTPKTGADLPLPVIGEWAKVSVTLPSSGGPYYIYLASSVGDWANGGNSKTAYVLIDNLAINGEIVEDFNNGLEGSKVEVVNSASISLAENEGYVVEEVEEQELAMKYIFNGLTDSPPAMITKEAIAGGSTISLKYYIPEGTITSWWGIAWHTDPSQANIYHAGGASSPMGYKSFSQVVGAWTTETITLPAGGPYYLYFGGEINDVRWRFEDKTPSWVLIDEFKVGDVYETFNYGVENSIFEIKAPAAARNSEAGEGYINPFPGDFGAKIYGDKISSTKTTPTFITEEAYTLTQATTVTFDYFMSGNTNSKWWILGWTNDIKVADIYAHVGSNKANNDGRDLPTGVQGRWATASVEVPAGTWYLYFGFAKNEWSGGYVIIDNFRIGDQVTEDFSMGIDESIFLVSPFSSHHSAVELAEGKEDFIPGEHAAKFDFSTNLDCVSTTFMTKTAVAKGGDTVSLKYYIPESSHIGDWWCISWSNVNTSAASYWLPNRLEVPNGGMGMSMTKGSWVDVSFTIPTDSEGYTYYLYLCAYGSTNIWSGEVYIDNFTVTRNGTVVAAEDFNGDPATWIFNIGNSSYVSYGEGLSGGSETPEEPELPESADPNALVNLIKKETVLEYLASGGYAYFVKAGEISAEGLPSTRIFVEGSFDYQITGEKEFAIYFGNNYYVVITQDYIALYNGLTKISMVNGIGAKNTISLVITADGKVIVGLGGAFYGLGTITEEDYLTINCIKFVALGGNGNVLLSNFNFVCYYCVASDVPTYFSDEYLDITAYNSDAEAMVSDAGYALLADAGFTKTMGLQQGRGISHDLHEQDIKNGACICASAEEHIAFLMAEVNADAQRALDLAQKYGMKHYVINSNLINIERNPNNNQWIDDMANLATYLDHPALAGHFFADEPQSGYWGGLKFTEDELPELKTSYEAYLETDFASVEAFINLLPMNSTQFSFGSYEDYVKEYVNDIGVRAGQVSFDMYPLHNNSVVSDHLRNLEIVRSAMGSNNMELRGYIHAAENPDTDRSIRAIESVNDYYMQMYSLLCFGAREIIYYRITAEEVTDSSIGGGIIGKNSLATGNAYNWAKQANNEIRAFENAYMNFNWNSVSIFGKNNTQFKQLKNTVGAYGYLTGASSTNTSASILVGNFVNPNPSAYKDNYAYMVMNYGDTGSSTASSSVTLNFNTATHVLVYQQGEPKVYEVKDGAITFNLMLGEGAFVIPFVR